MALPPSQTRSCNSALAKLGDSRRIASIDDPNQLGKTFKAVWDEAVDEVLAAHPWNRAVKRADLAVSSDYEPAGTQYAQAYAKPADCLRWLPWRTSHPDYFEGEEEGDFILSDAPAPLPFRYIARVTDLSKWSTGMLACLDALLAFKTARTITGSTTVMRDKERDYDNVLSDAKRQDGSASGDRSRHAQYQSEWLGARNGRPGGVRYR